MRAGVLSAALCVGCYGSLAPPMTVRAQAPQQNGPACDLDFSRAGNLMGDERMRALLAIEEYWRGGCVGPPPKLPIPFGLQTPARPPGPRVPQEVEDMNRRANEALREERPRRDPPTPFGRSNAPSKPQEPDPLQADKTQDPLRNPPSAPGEHISPQLPVPIIPGIPWGQFGFEKPRIP